MMLGYKHKKKDEEFLLDLFNCKSMEELKVFFKPKPEAYVRPDTKDSE